MATQEEVAARREENNRLREQITEVRRKQADELAAANQDIAMQRADREHQSLENELAALMGVAPSTEVSSPPPPETVLTTTSATATPATVTVTPPDTAPPAAPPAPPTPPKPAPAAPAAPKP